MHSSADKHGNRAIGLVMSPRVYATLDATNLVSQRIIQSTFTGPNRKQWKSFQTLVTVVCYSLTSTSCDSDIESFYNDMQQTVLRRPSCIPGYPQRLQCSTTDLCTLCPWVYSNTPDRNSEQFTDFLPANALFSSNTIFQKHPSRLYTHRGPQNTLSQIDHIVCRQKYRNSVHKCNAYTFRPLATDHRVVVDDIKLSIRSSKPPKQHH